MNTNMALLNIPKITVSYSSKIKMSERPVIKTSADIYKLLKHHWDINTIELVEEFKVLLLNNAHRVLGIYEVSRGGLTGTSADPRLLFGVALTAAAPIIILAHNHPSGSLHPSRADELWTKKLVTAASFLEMQIMDHIIITAEKYFSFSDSGLL